MTKVKTVKKEALELLRVAKLAFKFIRDNDLGHDAEQEELLKDLQAVIDRADPPVFDESSTTVSLVMTHATKNTILEALEERRELSTEDEKTLDAFRQGIRETKQRVYVTLDIDFSVLKKLHFVLRHTKTAYQDNALERLSKEIEEQGFSKNPMQILGEMGL